MKTLSLFGAACAASIASIACSPCAQAQTSPSSSEDSVQLYGAIDVGILHSTGIRPYNPDDDAPPSGQTLTINGLSQAGATGSYLGVRGTESLGGGLRLSFRAETGFCNVGLNEADAGGDPYCSAGGFMQRHAWIQLASDSFGSLRAGRQVTMLGYHTADGDAFGNSYLGQVGNIGVIGNNLAGLDMTRMSQGLSWTSPKMQGLQLQAQYSPHSAQSAVLSDPDDIHDPSALLLGVRYEQPRWLAGLDWGRWQRGIGPTEDLWDRTYRMLLAYASVDLGGPRLYGQWQHGSAQHFSGHQETLSLSLSLPLGRGTAMVSIGRFGTSMALQPTQLGMSYARQLAIGYAMPLSPRTTVYASASHIDNEAPGAGLSGTALAVDAAGNLFQGVPGRPSSGIGVGISHTF